MPMEYERVRWILNIYPIFNDMEGLTDSISNFWRIENIIEKH